MLRMILGAGAAAVAMLIVTFLFFATPLNRIGTGTIGDVQAGQLQSALAQSLPQTGTYAVPGASTAEQTALYGRGPIATVHFNASGVAASNATMMLWGMALNFGVAFLLGYGLLAIDRRVPDFPSRARLVVPLAVAGALYVHLSRGIYLHHDLANVLYGLVGDGLVMVVGGLVVAWFVPSHRASSGADAMTAAYRPLIEKDRLP